jgi:hypothetical protein
VDDQDGAGARGDGAFDCLWIEIKRDGVNLREYRCSADLQDCVGYGDECEGGDDNLVAFADAERQQGEMESCGAGADGYCVRNVVICG